VVDLLPRADPIPAAGGKRGGGKGNRWRKKNTARSSFLRGTKFVLRRRRGEKKQREKKKRAADVPYNTSSPIVYRVRKY